MFAFGIVMWELLHGKLAWEVVQEQLQKQFAEALAAGAHPEEARTRLAHQKLEDLLTYELPPLGPSSSAVTPPVSTSSPPEAGEGLVPNGELAMAVSAYAHLARACMQQDPKARPSFPDAVRALSGMVMSLAHALESQQQQQQGVPSSQARPTEGVALGPAGPAQPEAWPLQRQQQLLGGQPAPAPSDADLASEAAAAEGEAGAPSLGLAVSRARGLQVEPLDDKDVMWVLSYCSGVPGSVLPELPPEEEGQSQEEADEE